MDIDDFEQRLNTSQSFMREKPQKYNSRTQSGLSQTSQKQPQSLKDLNDKMQENLLKKQSIQQKQPLPKRPKQQQQFSQTQQIPKGPEQKRKSVEPNKVNSSRQILEQAARDNQELLAKLTIMRKQIQSLEAENAELKQEIQRKANSSGFLPKIESATNSEVKLLRMENEELKKVISKQYGNDSGKMLQIYGLQVVKLKCKIEELEKQQ